MKKFLITTMVVSLLVGSFTFGTTMMDRSSFKNLQAIDEIITPPPASVTMPKLAADEIITPPPASVTMPQQV